MRWQVQEAKQRFSELLRAVESGEPQVVTRHGEAIAVVIDIREYRHLRGEAKGLMEFLRAEPLLTDDVEIERSRERPRPVELAE